MNDLVQMLSDQNIGVNISLNLTNCLLFADDVVLMAESPRELQTLLQISHQFAKKWNLKFNSKKSKLMVVGKRINNNSTWKLGDESIEEVSEYKYLGYFVNRTLKSNFHICNLLKEKADKQLNYMIRVLEEHGDFNRLTFGDALWNSVIRPSLTHASAVWMPLS